MSRTSCIVHPKRNPTIVLRADYLAICDGSACAAMILSQMEHWHNVKLDHRPQARAHNAARARAGEPETQDTGLYVYKSQPQMKSELMGMFGDKAIGSAFQMLIDKGFLSWRENEEFRYDRTKQYLFCVSQVQAAVNALPAEDEDEAAELPESMPQKCALGVARMRDASGVNAPSKTQNRSLSSETALETTKKTTPKTPAAPGVLPSALGEKQESSLSAARRNRADDFAFIDKLRKGRR